MELKRETVRVAKFSTVGAVAFVVDLGLFNLLLLTFGVGPVWSKIASVAAATLVSWIGSRYWTFRDGKNESKTTEALAFFLTNAAGLLIAVLCLWVSHYLLGFTSVLADNISGNVIGILLGNIFRYFMYRFVIFKPSNARRTRLDI